MVDGVNKGPNNHTTLKLKGKDGKTINLQNLQGLQKTEKNKALFEMYDKDKNGVIDEKEAAAMRNNLQSLAGNGTISKREINKLFGKESNALDALSTLADQQAAFEKGLEYKETSGNKTAHFSQGYSYAEASEDGKLTRTTVKGVSYTETKNEDGSTTFTMEDGTSETQYKDGSKYIVSKDGSGTLYDSKGNKVKTTNPDNSTIEFTPDGNKSISRNADEQITSTLELRNGNEVRTNFEYADGKTIAREYNGSEKDAPLSSITVSGKNDGHNVDTKYDSEENFKNGRPSEEITDPQNPTLKKTTKFTYDSNGNIKAETTDSAGNVTTKYTNAKGEEINPKQYDAAQTYTVQKGDSITKIVTQALEEQGFSAEDIKKNPDILKNAKAEFLEANKDLVKTYNGSNEKLKGNKFFYPNDKVTVPSFTIDGGTLDTVEVTAKKIDPELAARRKDIQQKLGDNFVVDYQEDGTIAVRDKQGNILPEATKKANEVETSDNEDIDTMLKSDSNGNKKLEKDEYSAFIKNMLAQSGIEITDANKAKLEELIENSFNSMDTIEQDKSLTREELTKNAPTIIQKFTQDLEGLE